MSINYLDTVTMYYPCPYDIRHLFTAHWIWDDREQDKNLHHFCISTPFSFVRFYPDMYGYRRLYATFSLPKLYYQCNNNSFNVADFDSDIFIAVLNAELNKVLDMSQLPILLAEWQPSRNDFFRMRAIPPVDRTEYHYGYGRLVYRGVQTHTYKNTNYLSSSRTSKTPYILLREYNKTLEQQEKHSFVYGNLPAVIEKEHEQLMYKMDTPVDQYRFEFSLRRNAIVRLCDKYNLPVNMETVMCEEFQRRILNDLVISRGLHHHILCKSEYRRIVKALFTKHSADLALKLAESIRNKKPAPMKPHQRYRVQRELNSYYISTATTNFVSIRGLELL